MRSKKLVIGNWKMNPSSKKETEKLFRAVVAGAKLQKVEVVIAPPFVYLDFLKKLSNKIPLGAQNISSFENGAHTGEVSASMAYEMGARYVILGHSERRAMGETDEIINRKLRIALKESLVPILCVGESDRDDKHRYFKIVESQLQSCLAGVSRSSIENIIFAYEPVWAISTTPDRRDATPEDSREMAVFIRKILSDKFGLKTEDSRILYGGSVNEKDVFDFLKDGGVNGVLVGGASLHSRKFLEIINIAGSSLEKR